MDKKGDRKSPSENTTLKQRHSHSTNGDVKDKSNLLDIMHQERQDREKIVLWRKPLKTIHFSCLETASLLNQAGKKYVLLLYRNLHTYINYLHSGKSCRHIYHCLYKQDKAVTIQSLPICHSLL